MCQLKLKIEGDEYEAICCDLLDIALTLEDKNCRVLLRVLQLLMHGEWEEPIHGEWEEPNVPKT